jgi:IS5 family transposase
VVLRVAAPPPPAWEVLLPAQVLRLPDELAKIDTYLDDEQFIRPWQLVFSAQLGRPSVPVATLLRLLYLKHRYQLGYESLCAEVADSIGWRRFCRIPLDQPVPHPTTLVKLVGRAGPQVIAQLNTALLGKLAGDKVLRCRKLRIDSTVIAADIDHPTDADLLEHAVRVLGGLVRRIKQRGAACRTPFQDRSRSAGRCLRQLARTLRRRTGQAPAEIDRLTAQVATIARKTLAQAEHLARNARRAHARRPGDGRLGRLVTRLTETIIQTHRLLAQTRQRRRATASSPTGWSPCVTRTPARSARASRAGRPSSATPCCWPSANAALSPPTTPTRATRTTRPSSSRRSPR